MIGSTKRPKFYRHPDSITIDEITKNGKRDGMIHSGKALLRPLPP
jgi:hypothetical protein